jgi:hypothetical protein
VRTTLDIEADVLQAAKELAERDGSTAGRVLSNLARLGLASQRASLKQNPPSRGGVPVFPSRGEVITLDKVNRLLDQEGV